MAPHILLAMLCLAVAEEPRQRLAPRRRAASADDHCLEICAFASGGATCLEALPLQDEGCPSDAHIVDMPDCSGPLGLGDLCEADGECKTNKRIDNCEYVGLQVADIYRVVTKPSAAPSPARPPRTVTAPASKHPPPRRSASASRAAALHSAGGSTSLHRSTQTPHKANVAATPLAPRVWYSVGSGDSSGSDDSSTDSLIAAR